MTKSYSLYKSTLILFLWSLAMPCLAETNWSFVRLGQNITAEPKWEAIFGTARVLIVKRHIKILAFERLGSDEPMLIIDGTLAQDGKISGKATYVATDADPVMLSGTMRSWKDTENWGGKKKIVTFHEIVFPFRPHCRFYGFVSREVAD